MTISVRAMVNGVAVPAGPYSRHHQGRTGRRAAQARCGFVGIAESPVASVPTWHYWSAGLSREASGHRTRSTGQRLGRGSSDTAICAEGV